MINKSRKIYLFFTKSITFNTFLKTMTMRLGKNFDVILYSQDVEKIKSKEFKKKNIFIPTNFLDLIKFKKIFKSIFEIHKITNNNNNIIFCHTPAISHFLRCILFFKKSNIIYFVHGFRFNDSRNFIKNYFFKIIKIIFFFNTKYYITINNSDFKFVKKILKKPVIKIWCGFKKKLN